MTGMVELWLDVDLAPRNALSNSAFRADVL